jgi:hypothetical protein
MLVLPMEGTMKCAVDMGSGGTICMQSYMKIGTGVRGILRFCLSNLKGCNVGISDGRDYEVRR